MFGSCQDLGSKAWVYLLRNDCVGGGRLPKLLEKPMRCSCLFSLTCRIWKLEQTWYVWQRSAGRELCGWYDGTRTWRIAGEGRCGKSPAGMRCADQQVRWFETRDLGVGFLRWHAHLFEEGLVVDKRSGNVVGRKWAAPASM